GEETAPNGEETLPRALLPADGSGVSKAEKELRGLGEGAAATVDASDDAPTVPIIGARVAAAVVAEVAVVEAAAGRSGGLTRVMAARMTSRSTSAGCGTSTLLP